MKVVSDTQVQQFLDSALTAESICRRFQPALLASLNNYHQNPDAVPPRVVQPSPQVAATHLFMPCAAPNEVGIKLITGGEYNNERGLGFQGCVVVLDPATGQLNGVVNAKTLTAFRTALATSVAMTAVIDPFQNEPLLPGLAVFGVGLQAYWHVKLALILYAGRINKVKVFNRNLSKAEQFAHRLGSEYSEVQFEAFTVDAARAEGTDCSIVFGCTPSTEPVITERFLNHQAQWRKFIGLIGSYKPHMKELDPAWLRKRFGDGVKVIVDLRAHVMAEAGEIIDAELGHNDMIELIELSAKPDRNHVVAEGNIAVLKIVGLSIMDISMAQLVLAALESEIAFD